MGSGGSPTYLDETAISDPQTTGWARESGRYRGVMRTVAGMALLALLAGCSTASDGEPAPPAPSTSAASDPASPTTTSEAPDPPTTEPLVIAVHVRRPPADLSRRQAGLLLDGGVTRWSQLGLPGGPLTVTRKPAALADLPRDTVAIVPAHAVGPGVRVLSVDGIDPLRDPDAYSLRVVGSRPGPGHHPDRHRRHHARSSGR